MFQITQQLAIPLAEIELSAVRAQGAGGQNLHKTASAVHLRFDIAASSLPETLKLRLRARRDQRISGDGVVVIKAQQSRSQEQNRAAALDRLRKLLVAASHVPRARKPTRPTRSSQRQRVDLKVQRGRIKNLRRRVEE